MSGTDRAAWYATLATPTKTENSSRNFFFRRYANEVDENGFSPASYKWVERCVSFLYKYWFRVQIAGIGNVPPEGSAQLFGNHSGGLPVDGFLFYDGLINHHYEPRRIRFMVSKFLLKTKGVGDILRGFGAIPAAYESAVERLQHDDLVFIYPEAEKGTGKLYKNRYKLVKFHSGFVRAAIETGSPLVPVVTIGGDEIYPVLATVKPIAKLLGWPYFPLTPFFPFLPFPFYSIPLPVSIVVVVWNSYKLKYPPEAAKDEDLVARIVDDIQDDIQQKVTDILAMRTSPFAKWNMDKVNMYLQETKSYSKKLAEHVAE